MFERSILAFVGFFCMASMAGAAVLTLDGLPDMAGFPVPYSEDGFDLNSTGGSGSVHLDFCCGPYSGGFSLGRTDGAAFSLASFDLRGNDAVYEYEVFDPTFGFDYAYIDAPIRLSVVGTLGGTVVQSEIVTRTSTPLQQFGIDFSNVDQISFGLLGADTALLPAGATFFPFASDVHLFVDNITLLDPVVATVPVPASGVLLVAGLGCGVVFRRIKSRKQLCCKVNL